jgi:alkylation response protein AidB-like acyl-CoA dehydrogenase
MPEQLTPSQQQLLEAVRAFARETLEPRRDMPADQARREVIDASRKAGFFAMTQPAAFGGSEATTLELTLVRDELAATNARHTGAVFGPGPGVLADVGEPLRSTYLAPLLAGDKRGGFAFTEPDDAPTPTRAVEDGDALVITGQKSYVTGGADADFINTLVQIGDRGPAMVVIDTALPGVAITRQFSSIDGSRHAAFRFDNARVPRSHIIGTPGEGMPRAMRQIGDTRLQIAAQGAGTMRWVLGYLTDHLLQPDRNGKTRGSREGVRLRYAELRIRAFAARSMVYRTARLADAGENVVNEGMACKVFATETLGEVVDTAIQLVGGGALVEDHPLAVLYRQVRSLRLAEGGSDVLRLNLARGQLDLGKGRI